MNQRQRYLETMLFGTPDRVPLEPGGGRQSTRERWHAEGLPEGVDGSHEVAQCAFEQAGGTGILPSWGAGFHINERMVPMFEEKVIEARGDTQVVQDWKGNICEISSEFTVEHLRNAIDFVTRRWIKCPVENRDDWEAMKHRYDADDESRLPANAEDLGQQLKDREHFVLPNHGNQPMADGDDSIATGKGGEPADRGFTGLQAFE